MFPAQVIGAFSMWSVVAAVLCLLEQRLIRLNPEYQYRLSGVQRAHNPVGICGIQRNRQFRISDVRTNG
jgi:hypothetical protein